MGKLSPASTKDLHISVAETILNKESGWKALTGTTDFGTIASDPRHKLAFDLFVDRVCGFVGAYYVALAGQVDALVFAGGIGEKSDRLRTAVVAQCACLGFELDRAENERRDAGDAVVREVGAGSPPRAGGRAHRVLVVRTDEQFEMARAAARDPALWEDDKGDVPELSLLQVTTRH